MKILLVLLLLASCHSDNQGHKAPVPEQEEDTSQLPFKTFGSRLTNNLEITGKACEGTESADADGTVFVCDRTQWLVVVDNVNNCTPEGCTDIAVPPTIALLQTSSGNQPVTFFDIEPAIPVSLEVERILNSVLVRFAPGEAATVVFK